MQCDSVTAQITLRVGPPGAPAAQQPLAGRGRLIESALAFREHTCAAIALLVASLALPRLALLLRILQLQGQLAPALAQLCCKR